MEYLFLDGDAQQQLAKASLEDIERRHFNLTLEQAAAKAATDDARVAQLASDLADLEQKHQAIRRRASRLAPPEPVVPADPAATQPAPA